MAENPNPSAVSIEADTKTYDGLAKFVRQVLRGKALPARGQPPVVFTAGKTGEEIIAINRGKHADVYRSMATEREPAGLVVVGKIDLPTQRIIANFESKHQDRPEALLAYACGPDKDMLVLVPDTSQLAIEIPAQAFLGDPERPAALGRLAEAARGIMWAERHGIETRYTPAQVYAKAHANNAARAHGMFGFGNAMRRPAVVSGPGVPVPNLGLTGLASKKVTEMTWRWVGQKLIVPGEETPLPAICKRYADLGNWGLHPKAVSALPIEAIANILGDTLPSFALSRRRITRQNSVFARIRLARSMRRNNLDVTSPRPIDIALATTREPIVIEVQIGEEEREERRLARMRNLTAQSVHD